MARSKAPNPKVYAVARGRAPGIYGTWNECQAQTKGYSGAVFKSFKDRLDAEAFMRANSSSAPAALTAAAAAASSSLQGRKRSRDGDPASNQAKKRAGKQRARKSNARLHITVHFDGGSRGNPGLAGAGAEVVVVERSMTKVEEAPGAATAIPPNTTTYSIREYCGERATNNYAEYMGLLAGLKKARGCIRQYASAERARSIEAAAPPIPLFRLEVYGDSNLIIQQLRGAWRCKNANIMPLYRQSGNLIAELRNMDEKSEVVLEHVYREQNTVADGLANEAMDRRQSWITSTGDDVAVVDAASDEDEKPAAAAVSAASVTGTNTLQITTSKPQKESFDGDESNDEYHC